MKNGKILMSILILIAIMCLHTHVQAKYTYSETETAIIFNVEEPTPAISIDVISIENSNIGYEQYANNSHEINIVYEIKTDSRIVNHLLPEDIKVKVDGKIIENASIESILPTLDEVNFIYQYIVKLKNIQGDGNLSVEIIEGAIKTYNNSFNILNELKTNINIDNTAPNTDVTEKVMENGCANVTVTSNELIKERNEWTISDDKMSISKEFPSNVSYKIDIIDYAGNIKETEIKITGATYIKLTYGAHNSNVGWSYASGQYNIAGRDAALASTNNKIESLIFRIDGNIDKDFLQARAYIRSFWQNAPGYCLTTNLTFNFGYNPSSSGWKSMLDDKLAVIDGKEFVQFGGAGMNLEGQSDINGQNKIPSHIAVQYPYGISAVSFKLKDYSKYSVIYQVYVPKYGWISVAYNETEASMGYPSVISAIRIAIIPNSELKDICDFWNEVTGTTTL